MSVKNLIISKLCSSDLLNIPLEHLWMTFYLFVFLKEICVLIKHVAMQLEVSFYRNTFYI